MKTPIFILLAALALATLACSLVTGVEAPQVTADSTETVTIDEPLPAELQTAFDALPVGDAANGEQIFTAAQPCHVCHMDQPVGPTFPGEPSLPTLAATRRPGYPADVYLYESIVNPSAYVVQGFQAGIMPDDFGSTLTRQELADLVAYLMTMR